MTTAVGRFVRTVSAVGLGGTLALAGLAVNDTRNSATTTTSAVRVVRAPDPVPMTGYFDKKPVVTMAHVEAGSYILSGRVTAAAPDGVYASTKCHLVEKDVNGQTKIYDTVSATLTGADKRTMWLTSGFLSVIPTTLQIQCAGGGGQDQGSTWSEIALVAHRVAIVS